MSDASPILLVKHAMPVVEAGRPPAEWRLSEPGRRRTVAMAATLRERGVTLVVTSPEKKAVETAEILAATLRVPMETNADVREHERPGLAFQADAGAFESSIREAFDRHAERTLGGESIDEAV